MGKTYTIILILLITFTIISQDRRHFNRQNINQILIEDYHFSDDKNVDLSGKFIQSIAIDTNNDKSIIALSELTKIDSPNWIVYDNSNSSIPDYARINFLVIDSISNIWVATDKGLIRFDGSNWFIYNTSNSGLPSNLVNSIAIDEYNNKWIGTGSGLAKFDGTNWTVYNTSNSGLPYRFVTSIAIDSSNGEKWIGTLSGGLANFDGTNWTVYNKSNSGLPYNFVASIAIDRSGNKWIGTFTSDGFTAGGLTKFDGTNWTRYTKSNSGLTSDYIQTINADVNGNIWVGCFGLVKFNGYEWTVYNTSNSSLPDNRVWSIGFDNNEDKWVGGYGGLTKFDGTNWTVYQRPSSIDQQSNPFNSIAFDKKGNKWISTVFGQVAVFNEDSVVAAVNNSINLPSDFLLYQNYPNPFNPTTIIKYIIPKTSHVKLIIHNALGEEITTLINKFQNIGSYKINFDGSNYSSGVYFYSLIIDKNIITKKFILLK